MKHLATIKGGNIVFDDVSAFALDKQNLEGQKIVITIEKQYKKRSVNQNNLARGVILAQLGNFFGYFPNEYDYLWDFIKIEIGHCKQTKLGIMPLPTKNLTSVQYNEFISKIISWASVEHHFKIELQTFLL